MNFREEYNKLFDAFSSFQFMNIIEIYVNTRSGCDGNIGEYELLLKNSYYPISLDNNETDIIREFILENIDFNDLPEHGTTWFKFVVFGFIDDGEFHTKTDMLEFRVDEFIGDCEISFEE